MQLTADPLTDTFREALSVIEPNPLAQRTRVKQTTWHLAKRTSVSGTVTFRIAGVTHTGPTFEVTTFGQVQAGVPGEVEVCEPTGTFPIAVVEVEVPETSTRTSLVAAGRRFQGSYVPPLQAPPEALRVQIRNNHGQEVAVSHRYQLRRHGDGAVARMSDTGVGRLLAVVTAPDETVWTGGERGGALYRVRPGENSARLEGQLLAAPHGRGEDLALGRLGRLHAIVFSAQVSGG